MDNFCQYCLKTEELKIKETVKHALWECSSLNNLYKNLTKELKIENLINNAVTINENLRLKKSANKPEASKIALKMKGDVITYTNAYPRSNFHKR